MATLDERITAVEDTNKDIKELAVKVAELVIAHEADLVVLKRQSHQLQRMLVIVAQKANWLDDEDLKGLESEG